jgi:outer membrane protein
MKKLFFLGLIIFLFTLPNYSYGQRIGYIDLDSILSRLPEYIQVQNDLEQLSKNWEAEIVKKRENLRDAKFRFESEKLLLPDKMRRDKEEEIARAEKSLIEQQSELFGFDGKFFRKRQELTRPIQERVFKAAQIVAKKHKLNIIIDRSRDLHFVYLDPTYDFTEYVLEELGLKDKDLVIER